MHFLYILYSKKLNRYYIGETADVSFRLKLHLDKAFSTSFTSRSDDWELVFSFQTQTKIDVRKVIYQDSVCCQKP
ncbi:GIY-YIG nuclease family protein [Moheibacter lacus]|uniref:GIY-YIG nuclease family protein n=1 Tax=Moheibacter lacus TaxID=2745851 RepID=A0A838ZNT9_9FLAO|nr:GIY-YIG nuclease family protein [Moheibacter lacus]